MRSALIGQNNAAKPDILSTHPSTPERIAAALQAARQIGAPGIGETARPQYLAAIDGMAFGDDPVDGAIRGRKFIHPRLGFSFEAPEGYALENSAQAVLGVADGGAEALRFDSVRAPEGKSLTDYLTSGWIDGLLTSTIRPGTVNGLPAVFADARAGEWNFRVAVVAFHDDLYRIIFAIRAMTPDADKKFDESINSFRPITPEEAKLAQPLHIRLALAGPGDNAADACRENGPDRPAGPAIPAAQRPRRRPAEAGRDLQDRRLLSAVASRKKKSGGLLARRFQTADKPLARAGGF